MKCTVHIESLFTIGIAAHHSKQRIKKKPRVHPFLSQKAEGLLQDHQLEKLSHLLEESLQISSKDGSVVIEISLKEFLSELQLRCRKLLHFNGVRLCGSGATTVLAKNSKVGFNDLDFTLYLLQPAFDDILQIEEEILGYFIQREAQVFLSAREIYEQFFLDCVKIESPSNPNKSPQECWSLITIGVHGKKTIDIRFVFRSKRSYVFSTDSFEIVINPLLSENMAREEEKKILVESLYGNLEEALLHLESGRLHTKEPNKIRRGIYRYCYELAKGKQPHPRDRTKLEEVFVQSFLKEENPDFQDTLSKFLTRHPLNSLDFLQNIHDLLIPHEEAKAHLETLDMFIEKLKSEDDPDNSDGDQLLND